ncbi:MAG: hypothetical protein RL766_1866 [Bacteroidota bacterium]
MPKIKIPQALGLIHNQLYTHKKSQYCYWLFCREDQIRTGDPLHPMQVRYRAAPLPERVCKTT